MVSDTWTITKEMLKENACWYDDFNFITTIKFTDFPKGLLNGFSDLIQEKHMEDGYLCCEYWLPEDESDVENFVYEFNFEDDSVSVNEYFRDPMLDYNEMIKEIAMEMQGKGKESPNYEKQ